MTTWLITGGAGFIGSNFVRMAMETTDARVVIFDKLTYAGNLQNLAEFSDHVRFHFIQADIADRGAVEHTFREFSPSAVLNFAAESHVDRSIDEPEDFLQTNVVGTFNLLEAARAQMTRLNAAERERFRFLHVSTDEVYGSLGPSGAFSEDTPYAPNSPYSATKAGADHLVRAHNRTFDLPTLVTNSSNNYGPHQFPEKLIPLVILSALQGKPLPIYGDGGNIRDWLYVEDHCRGILATLERGRVGQSYNIGASCERTNLQIVNSVCRELEALRPAADNNALRNQGISSYADLKTFVEDRPGHDRRYAIDSTKIQTELAWNPQFDLESGLRHTVAWYVDNLDWCEAVQSGSYRGERLGTPPAR
ncbi:MAG: dTDP-glucose 4,6-dehydratase [Myxococcota bacterium]